MSWLFVRFVCFRLIGLGLWVGLFFATVVFGGLLLNEPEFGVRCVGLVCGLAELLLGVGVAEWEGMMGD